MSGYSEEELNEFVSRNRELIESMMELQRGAALSAASAGRDVAHDVANDAAEAAVRAKAKAEELMQMTYNMVMDPEVQRHFMTMGLEFMAGLSAMMQKAPMPDFMKAAAAGTEQSWKQSACRTNEDCAAKASKAQRVKVDVGDDPDAPKKDIPQNIIVTDASDRE